MRKGGVSSMGAAGTAAAMLSIVAGGALPACRRGPVGPAPPTPLTSPTAGSSRPGADRPEQPDPTRLLAAVVDPWQWSRAAGATDRERALEDIGPYESVPPEGGAQARIVNSNADYWTNLVGLAFTRDVDIDFDHEPVDLDADGVPDTEITRHIHAKGGILANPALFGLVPTPDDPRGRLGRISISTGVLGLREAALPDGRASGQIGMTCFLCHGGIDPDPARDHDHDHDHDHDRDHDPGGRMVLGLPGWQLDYGLLLATAALLDDANLPAAAARRAHAYPSGRTVRARLLMAGPGRQDLTGEFGLDVTVPGLHSARYPGTRRVRQGTTGIVNPISVPGILAAPGVDLQNWSGSEVASVRWLRRLFELSEQPPGQTLRLLGLPGATEDDDVGPEHKITGAAGAPAQTREKAALSTEALHASAATRRALLLDLRNLGTLGLQQDSFPGLLWADAIYGHSQLRSRDLVDIPALYSTAAIRRVLSREALAPPPGIGGRGQAVTPASRAAAARGREIFANRTVGVIANRQILKDDPIRYAAAKPGGTAHAPILAPIDEALPEVFPVRCADCHSATPGGTPVALTEVSLPLGRCSHCHRAHQELDRPTGVPGAATAGRDRHPLSWFRWPVVPAEEVAWCGRCHPLHRPFAPVVWSSSLLLPFDADGDGRAQDDEADDARAGGIGTESLLAFDVPSPQRPAGGFAVTLPFLPLLHSLGPTQTARTGVSWVRVPPLVGVRATSPYLHNGSVPTLRALLDPAHLRPVVFPLGKAGFIFDTRLAGNRNFGHEFGSALTAREKDDLVAFLQTL